MLNFFKYHKNLNSLLRIGVVSFSLLLYQILLTRIFSVITWYHLAFIAISLSMFGLCLGGLATYMFPKFFSIENSKRNLLYSGVLMGVSTTFSVLFLSVIGQVFIQPFSILWLTLVIYIFCSLPFFFGGSIISILFKEHKEHLGKLYAFDLFAAGLACYAVVYISKIISTPYLIAGLGVLIIFVFCLLIENKFLFYKFKVFFSAIFLILALGAFLNLFVKDKKSFFRIKSGEMQENPKDIQYEKWNSFSRIIVLRHTDFIPFGWGLTKAMPTELTEKPIEQYHVVIDGGAGTVLTKFNPDLTTFEYLKYDVTNLAHYVKQKADVFVVGIGGGRDILTSLVFKQNSIEGAEINEAILETLNIQFGDFTGHLDQMNNVKFVNDEARSYLLGNTKKYDLIVMSLIDTFAASNAGAFSLSENSLYTKEAFKIFLKKLNNNGIVSVSRWWVDPYPNEAYKLLKLTIDSLKEIGVSDPAKHIYAVRTQGRFASHLKKVDVVTVLFSPNPLIDSDIATLDAVVKKLELTKVLNPNFSEGGTIYELINDKPISEINLSRYNLKTPTDDSPFFFQAFKIDSFNPIKANDNLLKNLLLFLWVGTIFLITIIIISYFINTSWKKSPVHYLGLTFYFAFIGLGYLLIEMSQMQRLSIFLGHPTYSLTTTLFSFLICSGLGSLYSYKVQQNATFKKYLILFILFLTTLFMTGYFTIKIIELSSNLSLYHRILISFILLAPSAFFMGIMLPIGISFLKSDDTNSISWLWGINGGSSVISTILASVVSIYSGISTTYWVGFNFYLLAVLAILIVLSASKVESTI